MGPRPLLGLLLLALSGSAAGQELRQVEVAQGESLGVWDAGSGPVVVLVPSLTTPAFAYRKLVPLLVAAGHRALVIDPLGLGGSSQPGSADYSLVAQADRVGRALDALDVSQAVFVGQAASASIAMRLAWRRPEVVVGIVSIEGGVAESVVSGGVRRAVRLAPIIKLLGGMRLVRGRVRKTLIERAADTRWVTPAVVDGYVNSLGRDFDAVLRTYRLMAGAKEAEPLAAHLRKIRCPVLLLNGASPHPGGVPEREVALMRAQLPSLTMEEVPRSGHFIAEEAPEAVVRAVGQVVMAASQSRSAPEAAPSR